MRITVLAILLFCFGAQGATNIQGIQTFATGTNGAVISTSVLAAGQVGVGTWDYSGTQGNFEYLRVTTNHAYKLPHWMTKDGTNYDAVFTNWVYWSSNAFSTYDRARFTLPGATWGPQSNMWVGFYFYSTMTNTTTSANFDLFEFRGADAGFFVLQQVVANSGPSLLKAHAGNTNGWAIYYNPGVVYWVTAQKLGGQGWGSVRVYEATNNFRLLTNEVGGFDSVGSFASGTNTGQVFFQQNYFNIGSLVGTNYFSSLFFGWGNDVLMPEPETNAIISDRYTPLVVGRDIGVLNGVRLNPSLGTNATFYNVSSASDDNSTNFNAMVAAANSNTFVLLDGNGGPYKLRSTVTWNKGGVVVRFTNNPVILLGAGAELKAGPTGLTGSQAKQFTITSTLRIGATNATLSTNYSAVGSAGFIAPGQMYQLSVMGGHDPQRRNEPMSGERSIGKDVVIVSTNGNSIVFWPPLRDDYTNAPMLVQLYAQATQNVGFEGLCTITTTNAGVYETNAGTHNFRIQGIWNGWWSGTRSRYANNYHADLDHLINFDFNSNDIRYASVRSVGHGGVQITGGSPHIYDNIIDAPDRSIQLNGGASDTLIAANFMTNSSFQAMRSHAPGNDRVVVVENDCNDGVIMLGDGYTGRIGDWVVDNNDASQLSAKRFNPGHTIIRNRVAAAMEKGFPNLGNLTTNGLSAYAGPFARRELQSGPAFNFPGTAFTGSFGVSPYLGASYTNIYFTFTDVATQVAQGTNILGDFSAWPYASGGGYPIIFQDGVNTNRYWKYSDFTNDPVEQVSIALQAWIQPSNGVMVLNRYMPISNGWTMLVAGPDMYQQRQTIDNESFQETANVIGGTPVNDPRFLPMSYRASLLYDSAPSWWGTNEWPFSGGEIPAKTRYLSSEEGGGGAPGDPGLPASTLSGRVTITGRAALR